MKILCIPEGDEIIARTRFYKLLGYVFATIFGTDMKMIGDKGYGVHLMYGRVYFVYSDDIGIMRWELVIPESWLLDCGKPLARVAFLSDTEFVADFHEFIDDYTEGSPTDYAECRYLPLS